MLDLANKRLSEGPCETRYVCKGSAYVQNYSLNLTAAHESHLWWGVKGRYGFGNSSYGLLN